MSKAGFTNLVFALFASICHSGEFSAKLAYFNLHVLILFLYPLKKLEEAMKTRRSATRIMESKRRIFTDSLSVPKIIGNGPIIMAPPPLTLPSLKAVKNNRMAAINVTKKPVRIRMTPMFHSCSLI